MSKTINGFETALVWGVEANQGTAASSYPYLWNSTESDSLVFGEEPIDGKILSGVRGQNSAEFRAGQNLPGGGMGKAHVAFGTDATAAINILLAHFQEVTETGTAAPYTYTATPCGSAIDDGSFHTISVVKQTGVADKCHGFYGCLINELEIGWEAGGAIYFTPSGLKAMSSSNTVTMPAIPAVSDDGFIQAPNITVTWNGTTIQPAKWSFRGVADAPDKRSGSARGRWGHALGDYSGKIDMDIWRSDSSDNYVDPFYDNTVGTLVIAGTMDAAYGEAASGSPVTFTITAHCMLEAPNDLPTGDGDIIDTISLRVMNDTKITVSITAASTGLI